MWKFCRHRAANFNHRGGTTLGYVYWNNQSRKEFGKVIRQSLKRQKKTQAWLASELGSTGGALSRYLNGEVHTRPAWDKKICVLLGIDPPSDHAG